MKQRITEMLICCLCLFSLAGCSKNQSSYDYRIGIDPSWYPLALAGREKAMLGFSSELLQDIATVEKIQLAKINVNWDSLLEGLEKAKYEAILSSMQPHLFYQNKYDFSDLYIQTGPVLVVPASSSVSDLAALNGKEVAIQSGSSSVLLLAQYPGIIIRSYDSIPKALDDVASETIEGAVIDALEAAAYCQDLYQGKLRVATKPLNDAGLRLMTLHDKHTQLIKKFNAGLIKLKEKGRYDELLKKWGLPTVEPMPLSKKDRKSFLSI